MLVYIDFRCLLRLFTNKRMPKQIRFLWEKIYSWNSYFIKCVWVVESEFMHRIVFHSNMSLLSQWLRMNCVALSKGINLCTALNVAATNYSCHINSFAPTVDWQKSMHIYSDLTWALMLVSWQRLWMEWLYSFNSFSNY